MCEGQYGAPSPGTCPGAPRGSSRCRERTARCFRPPNMPSSPGRPSASFSPPALTQLTPRSSFIADSTLLDEPSSSPDSMRSPQYRSPQERQFKPRIQRKMRHNCGFDLALKILLHIDFKLLYSLKQIVKIVFSQNVVKNESLEMKTE